MSESQDGKITQLLQEIESGNELAKEKLVEVAYDELRELAGHLLRRERSGHTLQPTALVHEAMIRMLDAEMLQQGRNRAYFFGAMARAMRRALVDHARKRNAERRGGGHWERQPLDQALEELEQNHRLDMLCLDEALEELQELSHRQSEVVHLHFFGGLTHTEIAEQLQVSLSTIEKDWRMARAWLLHRLSGTNP